MSATQSDLSSAKYGYDFVVATTQASINSGLKEYLAGANEPTTYLCFLADQQGNPTQQISLDDLLTKTGGVNPFDIPAGTQYDDPRITTLTQNMFVVGLQLKMGLPPGILPADIPDVVDLGTSASAVTFNLFCSEFTVIQNSPPSGFGGAGSWNVWSQPSGAAWYFSTSCDLVTQDLANDLNTPYFTNHPDQKAAILAQMNNLSGSAFSLQQLLFDLDNAAVQSIPTIEGLPAGSDAEVVLTKSFVDLYFQTVKAYGQPVLSVHAVAQTPDNASLRLTALNREVNPYVDSNGSPVNDPSPQQQSAVTLNLQCAANNDPLPGSATFSWNWVDAASIDDEDGVVSVNRKTLARWLYAQMLPTMQPACLTASTSVDAHWYGRVGNSWNFSENSPLPPTADSTAVQSSTTQVSVTLPDSGSEVLQVSYANQADASDSSGATSAELDLHPSYTCTVTFSGQQITITQRMWFWLKVRFDATSADGNVVDRSITDTLTLQVTENGELAVTAGEPVTANNDQDIDLNWFVSLFVDMNDLIDNIKKWAVQITNATLTSIPSVDVQSFVFPGAQVFSYKDVVFSDTCDLTTAITYVAPSS